MRSTALGGTAGRYHNDRHYQYQCEGPRHVTIGQPNTHTRVLEGIADLVDDPELAELLAAEVDTSEAAADRKEAALLEAKNTRL